MTSTEAVQVGVTEGQCSLQQLVHRNRSWAMPGAQAGGDGESAEDA